MKKIVLISCGKNKTDKKNVAEKLYISPRFRKSLQYARENNADKIFILSAKHGLVHLDQELEPYDVTLNNKTAEERKQWSKLVIDELKKEANLDEDNFIILAGKDYCEYLLKDIKNYSLPFKHLRHGEQHKWLNDHISTRDENAFIRCQNIHDVFNHFKRYSYPFDLDSIPKNGLYVMFEKGEYFDGKDRITRVGTHTGQNNLQLRLKEHFITENKDRSIFRKNIGRALLNKEHDPFLEQWNIDLTEKTNREKFAGKIDLEKQKEVERQVSDYIRNNISFCVFSMETEDDRLKYEKFLISNITRCKEYRPSENWLGNYSPVEKIRKSGMWCVVHVCDEKI